MSLLVQFQCQREGSLFYYQHGEQQARALVGCCPVCGSLRVEPTGRTYSPVNETETREPREAARKTEE